MDKLLSLSATEAAQAVRDGRTTSRELVEIQLARIDRVNPQLNALVEVRREEALARAEQADRAVRSGESLGSLHGVPITIKEAFQVAGFHSTWGVPEHAGFIPEQDAAVEAIRQAYQKEAAICLPAEHSPPRNESLPTCCSIAPDHVPAA